jgi:hypothetical protein
VQLNLHVPKDRELLVGRLESAAHQLGRPKNQIVLDAIERYLEDGDDRRVVDHGGIPVFHMGTIAPFRRADLYADQGSD